MRFDKRESKKSKSGYTWRVTFEYKDRYGKKKKYSKSGFPTKKAAQVHAAAVQSDLAKGLVVDNTVHTVDELFQQMIKLPGYSPNTISLYRDNYNKHILPVLGNADIKDLHYPELQSFFTDMSTVGKSAVATTNLGVSEAWLMGYDVPMGREARNKWFHGGIREKEEEKPRQERGNMLSPERLQIHLNTVPVYDPISCGTGKWVDEQPVDYLGVPDTMVSKACHYFANPAYGDSMEPRILNGDYIVFEQTESIDPGCIGAFSLNGEYFCKRFKKLPDGSMWLFSENPLYDPIPIQQSDDFRVLGKFRMRMTEN